jgi:3-dehydroquinate synthase
MNRKNIFLGGFMASGKTSVGKALSKKTGRPFVDTDHIIEDRSGMSVAQIFATLGEPAFRLMEKQVIGELAELEGMIVALGGGILADSGLKELIMQKGTLVVLSVLPETALRRAASEEGKRPLLDPENVHQLWEKRLPAYSNGHLIIESDRMTVEEEVISIMEGLGLQAEAGNCATVELRASAGGHSYPVFIGSGILGSMAAGSPGAENSHFLVADEITGPLFGERVSSGSRLNLLPRGEEAKTFHKLQEIFVQLQESGADRTGCLVALGGGTVGDVTGYAAASWMRGISFIQCPTTLLSQVDSSLGGKTGVNLPGGKNLVGAFHQPAAVFSDVDCLLSLSATEFRQGLAEVVKYALGHDKELFSWLKLHAGPILSRQKDVLVRMVEWCARIKINVVEQDEREQSGQRARLNLGHTIGHALEAASGYSGWKHGDAVSVGMVVASIISVSGGEMSISDFEELQRLLKTFGLPVRSGISWEELVPFIRRDKKFVSRMPRLVVPRGIGNSVLSSTVSLADVEHAYREVMLYGEKTDLSCC